MTPVGTDALHCAKCGHESASRGGADIHAAVAHAPGRPAVAPGPLPPSAPEAAFAAGPPRPAGGAGPAVVVLGFAVALVLFLGVLVAADRGWVAEPGAATAVAAASVATPTPPPLPAGWRTVADTAAGFTVTVPAGWTDMALDPATMDVLLKEVGKADPRFRAALDRQARQATAAGGRLLAFETERGGAPNLTVMVSDAEGATLGDAARAVPAELARLGAVNVSQERVSIAAGPALRLSYDLDVAGVALRQVMYMVIVGGDAFVVTLTSDDPGRDGPTMEGIARSFSATIPS